MTHLYTYELVVQYNFFADNIHEASKKMKERSKELEDQFLNLNMSNFKLVRIEDEDAEEVFIA